MLGLLFVREGFMSAASSSSSKRIVMRILLAVLVPLFFLLVSEGVVRLLGVGRLPLFVNLIRGIQHVQ